MAKLTKGYSFAFQVLGYFAWEEKAFSRNVIREYRQYLEDYVCEKIWAEMSEGDKRLAYGIANCADGKIIKVREYLKMETNQFNLMLS